MKIIRKIKLEQEQQICLLYCLKTFKNYKVTIFLDITKYCRLQTNIENGFITFKDYVVLAKIDTLLNALYDEVEYIKRYEFFETAEKFKGIFYKIEEKFMGGESRLKWIKDTK